MKVSNDMKQFFTSLLCISGLFGTLFCQSGQKAIVTGIVTDVISGDPIELATIYIKDTNIAS